MSERQDDFNAAAQGPSSNLQIKKLLLTVKTPVPKLENTPFGKYWVKMLSEDERQNNQKVIKTTSLMQRRLARKKSKARAAMQQAADRRSGKKDRRGNDLGR